MTTTTTGTTTAGTATTGTGPGTGTGPAPGTAPAGTVPVPDLAAAARRVDNAVERVGLLDPAARDAALALKSAVEEFHRAGLATVVRRLKGDPDGRRLLFELVDDPGVYALLLMHGLVRPDPVTLAERALSEVRPYLESHGGRVELVAVEPPVVRVRLGGACTGCSQSSATLRDVVQQALAARVPGIERVEVVPNAPAPTLVPLGEVRLRPGAAPVPSAGPVSPAPSESRSEPVPAAQAVPVAPAAPTGRVRPGEGAAGATG